MNEWNKMNWMTDSRVTIRIQNNVEAVVSLFLGPMKSKSIKSMNPTNQSIQWIQSSFPMQSTSDITFHLLTRHLPFLSTEWANWENSERPTVRSPCRLLVLIPWPNIGDIWLRPRCDSSGILSDWNILRLDAIVGVVHVSQAEDGTEAATHLEEE